MDVTFDAVDLVAKLGMKNKRKGTSKNPVLRATA
jgi:hypothetical protein